jgi:hypothetical protein
MEALNVVDAVRQGGGITVSLAGEYPTSGYIVAKSVQYEQTVPEGEFSEGDVAEYVTKYDWALAGANVYLGAWREDGLVFLDVVEKFTNKVKAMRAGREREQLAIYDVKNDRVIPTGVRR